MSKRRHKNKSNQNSKQGNISSNSRQGNIMGRLNPQMLEMLGLGNIDMNKVSEVLSSMGNNGFDMSSISSMLNNQQGGKKDSPSNNKEEKGKMNNNNNNPLAAMMGGGNPMAGGNPMGDLGSLMGLLGGGGTPNGAMNPMGGLGALANMLGGSSRGKDNSRSNNINNSVNIDPIVTMLLSLRNFVDPQRARFLDKVLKMYKEGKITY